MPTSRSGDSAVSRQQAELDRLNAERTRLTDDETRLRDNYTALKDDPVMRKTTLDKLKDGRGWPSTPLLPQR